MTTASWAEPGGLAAADGIPSLIRLGGEVGVEQMWIKSSQSRH